MYTSFKRTCHPIDYQCKEEVKAAAPTRVGLPGQNGETPVIRDIFEVTDRSVFPNWLNFR